MNWFMLSCERKELKETWKNIFFFDCDIKNIGYQGG